MDERIYQVLQGLKQPQLGAYGLGYLVVINGDGFHLHAIVSSIENHVQNDAAWYTRPLLSTETLEDLAREIDRMDLTEGSADGNPSTSKES